MLYVVAVKDSVTLLWSQFAMSPVFIKLFFFFTFLQLSTINNVPDKPLAVLICNVHMDVQTIITGLLWYYGKVKNQLETIFVF